MKIWVVVASAVRARMFEALGRRAPLHEVKDMVNPEDRLQQQEIEADRPGRAFDSMGRHRHAMGSPVDPKEQGAIRFAKEVVDELEAARHAKRFEALCLVASPHFLGLLRERMSDVLGRSVKGDLTKDLTREDAASVQSHVAHLL
jgi:protein required for attachment to host cells